jgi:hypothetical protein
VVGGWIYPRVVRLDVLQYLQRRLDDVRNMRLMPLDHERPDVVASALAGAGGALEALRGVSLISDEEFSQWQPRFWEAITGEPLPTVPTHEEQVRTATSVTKTATAVALPVPGANVAPPPPPRFQAIAFQRLIPGPDEEHKLGPGVLRVLALVQYEDGVEVEWLFSLPPEADVVAAERDAVAGELDALPPAEHADRLRERDRRLRWSLAPGDVSLSDDVGTVYQPQSGGAHGGFITIRGHRGFTPTLAAQATRAYVLTDDAKFTLAVA